MKATRSGFAEVRLLVAGVLCIFLLPCFAKALLPEQVALLINQNDQDSMTLGNHYRSWRGIPLENVFYLDVPSEALGAASTLSGKAVDRHILNPMVEAVERRGLQQRILVWVYSSGFPTRINAETAVSLQGYTLSRGVLPETQWIRQGKAVTPLYLGFEGQGGAMQVRPPIPFRAWQLAQGTNMPMPSMMLSHLGTRGLTLSQALKHLSVGLNGDGLEPKGDVLFERSDDIRTRTREFQFSGAIDALAEMGVKAEIVNEVPKKRSGIFGVLSGRPMVFPNQWGTFKPGAFADHLTSFSAAFDQYSQIKCAEWLRHGATATAGTVVEPMAIWTKFPSARLFELQASGLSMVEALFGATACPFQTLFLGDPLSSPYKKQVPLVIIGLKDEPSEGVRKYQVHPVSGANKNDFIWQFFIEGKAVTSPQESNEVTVDTRLLSDGYHRLDVLAIHRENAVLQGAALFELDVDNRGESVSADGPLGKTSFHKPVKFQVVAKEGAVEVGLMVQGRIQARTTGHEESFTLIPDQWGEGPVSWQAYAVYPKGRHVASPPQSMILENQNRAPTIEEEFTKSGELKVYAKDPDFDPIVVQGWESFNEKPLNVTDADQNDKLKTFLPKSEKTRWVGVMITPGTNQYVGIMADLYENRRGIHMASGRRFGVIYNYQDEDNFMFAGYGGGIGTWVHERFEKGVWKRLQSRGAPVFKGQKYTLEVIQSDGVIRFLVNDDLMMEWGESNPIQSVGVLTHDKAILESIRLLKSSNPIGEAAPAVLSGNIDYVRAVDSHGASVWKEIRD